MPPYANAVWLDVAQGEYAGFEAMICGEMAVESIPVNPSVDLAALKAGDSDPLEVVVAVPATKSKRGWDYKTPAIQSICTQVNSDTYPGYLGHQKAEDVPHQFPTPVTHWVGAKFDPEAPVQDKTGKVIGKGVGFLRGVIDQSAPDLKRWIRAGVVKTTSIFGRPKLAKVSGETHVVDYELLSNDWTPPRRAGMPTKIVAMGEMDALGVSDTDLERKKEFELTGELDGSYEELRDAVRNALNVKYKPVPTPGIETPSVWIYVVKTHPDHCIFELESQGKPTQHFKANYGVVNDEVQLGDIVEVKRKEIWEVVGEMTHQKDQKPQGQESDESMSKEQVLERVSNMLASGEMSVKELLETTKADLPKIAGEMDPTWYSTVTTAAETVSKVREALAVDGEMDVVSKASEAKSALDDKVKRDHSDRVEKVLGEKVTGEMAQTLVRKQLKATTGASEEEIAGEIATILADPENQTLLSRAHTELPTGGLGGGNGVESRKGTERRQSRIW